MGLFSKEQTEPCQVNGMALRCLVCGNDQFSKREALLNTAGASFLGFDWANASGICLICADCGYIHWFLPKN